MATSDNDNFIRLDYGRTYTLFEALEYQKWVDQTYTNQNKVLKWKKVSDGKPVYIGICNPFAK